MHLPNHGLPAKTRVGDVHGHADGGIHSHLFQCGNLAPRFDTARGDNRMGSRVAQPAEPFEVRARHRAFAVHVGAQESRAEVFELGHHFVSLKGDALPPAVNGDVSSGRVESDDDLFPTDCFCQLLQESDVYFSMAESGTSNNDLTRTPSDNFFGTRNGSNPTANAHLHAEILTCSRAQLAYQLAVLAFAHGRVQVNHVQPRIPLEFPQQAEDSGDGKLALPPAN